MRNRHRLLCCPWNDATAVTDPCGCESRMLTTPSVAEKTFYALRSSAEQNLHIHHVAVSHSDADATARWLDAVGGAGLIEVIVDADREIYGRWGLGVSSLWHVISPRSMWSAVQLGRQDGIQVRSTESGSRWQTAGSFGVDRSAIVRWLHVAKSADDGSDFSEAVPPIDK